MKELLTLIVSIGNGLREMSKPHQKLFGYGVLIFCLEDI